LLALSQVIFGVQDLDAADARMRALGVEVLDGGVHPGLGTANRIVPLAWHAAGLSLALQRGWLPFFMQWDVPAQYPGALSVKHPSGAVRVAWLEVCPAAMAEPARWTAGAEAPLRQVEGKSRGSGASRSRLPRGRGPRAA